MFGLLVQMLLLKECHPLSDPLLELAHNYRSAPKASPIPLSDQLLILLPTPSHFVVLFYPSEPLFSTNLL
jgi:hypothetical protein